MLTPGIDQKPIKTYTFEYSNIEEYLDEVERKEYIVSTFCYNQNYIFLQETSLSTVGPEVYLTFQIYTL